MKNMCSLHKVAFILVIVGGLNWLLFAFGYNLVEMIFGGFPMVEKAVYVLVGVSALMMLMGDKCCMGKCGHDGSMPAAGAPKA